MFVVLKYFVMDPETREMIEHTLELARDNNKMLKKIRGVQKREAVWRTIKAAIAVALALGLFYYVQPYVDKVMQVYSSVLNASGVLKSGASQGFIKSTNN